MMIEFDEYKVKLNGLKPKIDELAARSMRVLALGYSQQEMVHDRSTRTR